MSRINTNVNSLIAQNTLNKANSQLTTSLNRLSTGLRINSGKDDPAGLIASEELRNDSTSVEKAIGNSERAGLVIGTADSALGQVSSLLNDVKGLAIEAANSGALSDEEIAANQLQVDSSLEAINRIAQTTTFQGRKLLDGSLDFTTTAGTISNLKNVRVDQANLGKAGSVSVNVDITAAATKATLSATVQTATTAPGEKATGSITFADGSELSLTANQVGEGLNGVKVDFVEDSATAAGSPTATYDAASKTYTVKVNNTTNTKLDAVATAITGATGSVVTAAATGTGKTIAGDKAATATFAGGVTGVLAGGTLTLTAGTIDIAAKAGGGFTGTAGNAITVTLVESGASTTATAARSGNAITVTVGATSSTSLESIAQAIRGLNGGNDFTAATTTPAAVYDGNTHTPPGALTLSGGVAEVNATATVNLKGGGSITLNGKAGEGATLNGYKIQFAEDANTPARTPTAAIDATAKTLTITVNKTTNTQLSDIQTAINAVSNTKFQNALVSSGTALYSVDTYQGPEFNAGDNDVSGATASGVTGVLASKEIDFGGGDKLTVSAKAGGAFTGTAGNAITVAVVEAASHGNTPTAARSGNAITVTVDSALTTTFSSIASAIAGLNGGADFTATTTSTNSYDSPNDTPPATATLTGGVTEVNATKQLTFRGGGTLTLTGKAGQGAAANGYTISFVEGASTAAATPSAVIDTTAKTLKISVNDAANTKLGDIKAAIDAVAGGVFQAATVSGANDLYSVGDVGISGTTGGGLDAAGGLDADVTFRLGSDVGSQVFTFGKGTSGTDLAKAINLLADSTGVNAAYDSATGKVSFSSASYGTKSSVSLDTISEGTGGSFESSLSAARAAGTDIKAKINGIAAVGSGNSFIVNTSSLNLSLTVADGSNTGFDFSITGGGALFQLGPDVSGAQQARVGIGAVDTGSLGGAAGKLFELASGGSASLATDPGKAAAIIDSAITQVTSLRGRLGAFQSKTLETNINSLKDTLNNLTEAQSIIRDADFAKESAALTRAQILVQSSTTVLSLANQNPQNALSLLR